MRRAAEKRYIYRHTGEHKPAWAFPWNTHREQGGMWAYVGADPLPTHQTDTEWVFESEFPMANVDGTEFAPCWYQPRHPKNF